MISKRLLFIYFTIFGLDTGVQADDISVHQARQIAVRAFSGFHESERRAPESAKSVRKQAQPTLAYTMQQEGQQAALFVFNRNDKGEDGFVIVAGDDRVKNPVIGYSTKGVFDYDKAPANLRALLQQYSQQIDFVRTQANARNRAAELGYGMGQVVVEPLIKTQWDQGIPYNNMCPVMDDRKTYTGCGATAVAQILAYWKYPKQGRGSKSYHWNPTPTTIYEHSVDLSQSVYDWDNMLNSYAGDYDEKQADAVALLMRDVGGAINTIYDYKIGSGSAPFLIYPALLRYFDFNGDSIQCLKRYLDLSRGETDDFDSLLKRELDKKRPVLLSGSPAPDLEDHYMVVDGYTDADYFHMNFGWSGSGDGYYLTTVIDQGIENPEKRRQLSWLEQDAIIGICPTYSTKVGNNYYYTDGNQAVLCHSLPADGNATIQASITVEGTSYPVTKISRMACYENENLTSLVLPTSIKEIGERAFYNCSNLSTVTVPENTTPSYTASTLPDQLTTLGKYAFARSGLTDITVHASLPRIGDYAFYLCEKLSEATIHSKEVGVMAFGRCASKPAVTFYGEKLGDGAFFYHGVSSIYMNNVKHIGNDCLSHSVLDYLDLDKIETMGWNRGIAKSGGTIFIGKDAPIKSLRYGAPLDHTTNIVIEKDNPNFFSINNAVYSKDLKTLIHYAYKDNRISEGSGVYNYRTELTIPENVERINDYAFNVVKIKKLTIPSSVKEIGISNFADGVEIYNYAATPQKIGLLDKSYFDGCTMEDELIGVGASSYGITQEELDMQLSQPNSGTLHVPAGCMGAYAAADVWKNFAKIVDDLPAVGGGATATPASGVRIVANVQKQMVYPPTMFAYEFLFSTHPTLTYDRSSSSINAVITSDNIEIYTDDLFYKDGQVTITNMSLQKMTFFSKSDDGIEKLEKDDIPSVRFTVEGNTIHVSGMAANEHVSLYTTDGILTASAMTSAEGNASITLPAGQQVYIMKAGNTSFKLRVKK